VQKGLYSALRVIFLWFEVVFMLKMKKITHTYDMRVYTDSGDYFGDVEDGILTSNKTFGWKIKATKSSFLSKVLGSAKGVIVPHQLVKSVGDIIIISRSAVPNYPAEEQSD
jgi:sporulation protein YlmC with PRC-barrel domain